MADHTLLAVQEAFVEAITESASLGAYCRTIASYAGQLEADDLQQRPINTPAVFVELESTTSTPKANRLEEKVGVWNIYCLQENFRGNIQSRTGDGARIGTLTMLNDLQVLLLGNELGLNVTGDTPIRFWPLRLLTEEAVVNDARWSLYRARYQTQYQIRF